MAEQKSSAIGVILLIAAALVLFMLYKSGELSKLLSGLTGGSGSSGGGSSGNSSQSSGGSGGNSSQGSGGSGGNSSQSSGTGTHSTSHASTTPTGYDGTPYSLFQLSHAAVGAYGSQYDAAQRAAAAAWDAANPSSSGSTSGTGVSKGASTGGTTQTTSGYDGTPYSLFQLSHAQVGAYGSQYDAAQRAAAAAWDASQGHSQPTQSHAYVSPTSSGQKQAVYVSQSGGGSYTVQSGNTLSGIAASHGVSLSQLLAANPGIKNANMIQIGQRINLPGSGGVRVVSQLRS